MPPSIAPAALVFHRAEVAARRYGLARVIDPKRPDVFKVALYGPIHPTTRRRSYASAELTPEFVKALAETPDDVGPFVRRQLDRDIEALFRLQHPEPRDPCPECGR